MVKHSPKTEPINSAPPTYLFGELNEHRPNDFEPP